MELKETLMLKNAKILSGAGAVYATWTEEQNKFSKLYKRIYVHKGSYHDPRRT